MLFKLALRECHVIFGAVIRPNYNENSKNVLLLWYDVRSNYEDSPAFASAYAGRLVGKENTARSDRTGTPADVGKGMSEANLQLLAEEYKLSSAWNSVPMTGIFAASLPSLIRSNEPKN